MTFVGLDPRVTGRPAVYSSILGVELSKRERSHIHYYAVRKGIAEIALLHGIAKGKISVAKIEREHREWRAAVKTRAPGHRRAGHGTRSRRR